MMIQTTEVAMRPWAHNLFNVISVLRIIIYHSIALQLRPKPQM